MKAPNCYFFTPFFLEPVDQVKFRKVRINSFRFRCDSCKGLCQANAKIHIFDVRKTEICKMSIDSMFFEFEINWQPTEYIETSTHPSDEQALAVFELFDNRQI